MKSYRLRCFFVLFVLFGVLVVPANGWAQPGCRGQIEEGFARTQFNRYIEATRALRDATGVEAGGYVLQRWQAFHDAQSAVRAACHGYGPGAAAPMREILGDTLESTDARRASISQACRSVARRFHLFGSGFMGCLAEQGGPYFEHLQAVVSRPNNAVAPYYAGGSFYNNAQIRERTRAQLDVAVRARSDRDEINGLLVRYAAMEVLVGDTVHARALLEPIERLPEAAMVLADADFMDDDRLGAIRRLNETVDLFPANAEVHFALAYVLSVAPNSPDALSRAYDHVRVALCIAPDHPVTGPWFDEAYKLVRRLQERLHGASWWMWRPPAERPQLPLPASYFGPDWNLLFDSQSPQPESSCEGIAERVVPGVRVRAPWPPVSLPLWRGARGLQVMVGAEVL
jgi:hypothetical protein